MSETRSKRKVEFIESYWTGGEYGSDYMWSDNHGELVRCIDCQWHEMQGEMLICKAEDKPHTYDWFCAGGKRRDDDG